MLFIVKKVKYLNRKTYTLFAENKTESEPQKALRIVTQFGESWLLVLVCVCFFTLFLVLLVTLCYVIARKVRNDDYNSVKQALISDEKKQSKA